MNIQQDFKIGETVELSFNAEVTGVRRRTDYKGDPIGLEYTLMVRNPDGSFASIISVPEWAIMEKCGKLDKNIE